MTRNITTATLYRGACLDVLAAMEPGSVDAAAGDCGAR